MKINANQIKEQVSLSDLLRRLGYEPERKSGKELIYMSMLREENTPSFFVNDESGVWFDHGGPNASGIKGGNVIDFGLAYWYPCTFPVVLEKISGQCNIACSNDSKTIARPKVAVKIPHYQIEEIKHLGNNKVITAYLQKRGIWAMAHDRLKELYYYVEDESKRRKQFYAAGWANENGGWEVSNANFKGCLGHKGLTYIQGNSENLVLFEGMMDYLSWKYNHEDSGENILILNSLSLLKVAISKAMFFKASSVFFDHDEAGKNATGVFFTEVPNAKNESGIYEGYKDYNEFHMKEIHALIKPAVKPRKDYFADIHVGFSR